MKKSFFITIILLSSIVFAGVCDSWSYSNSVNSLIVPTKTGKYYAISDDNTYSNGERILKGNYFQYAAWEDVFWYNTHWISCKVKDIKPKSEYNRFYEKYESCYLLTLYCDVSERTQFYKDDVKYTDLKGYRRDGSLKWTRDKIGSTDIYCYNKSGMAIIKRVNDPQYCN